MFDFSLNNMIDASAGLALFATQPFWYYCSMTNSGSSSSSASNNSLLFRKLSNRVRFAKKFLFYDKFNKTKCNASYRLHFIKTLRR